MKNSEETIELALLAFWNKVEELHPERETQDRDQIAGYDLENYAKNAVEAWLEINKPVFYVQRTTTQVLRIVGQVDPDEAEATAASIEDFEWSVDSLDTNYEYIVLDKSGKQVT